MNTRPTSILVATALVLFAFIWFVERPIRQEQQRLASRKVLQDFDPAKVTALSVTPAGQSATRAVRKPNGWQLEKPIPYPAEVGQIDTLLNVLAQLEWNTCIPARELKNRRDAQKDFGFESPQGSLVVEEGEQSRQLRIGHTSAWGDQVYLEVGNGSIYLASAELLRFFPTNQNQWRDPALINVDSTFDALRVKSGTRNFEL